METDTLLVAAQANLQAGFGGARQEWRAGGHVDAINDEFVTLRGRALPLISVHSLGFDPCDPLGGLPIKVGLMRQSPLG